MKTNGVTLQKRYKMYMKQIGVVALWAILVLIAFPAKADTTLPSQCTAFRPEVLNTNIIRQSQIDALLKTGKSKKSSAWGQTVNTNSYWIVFSDRSDNVTYQSPQNGSAEYMRLSFGQELRIAQIMNNFALVYVETQPGRTYPQISTQAKSMGWIPMSHLLLWTDCPANESYIYKKALIVGNIDNARNDTKLGNLYKNPETGDGKTPLQSTMNFFFQMKTAENGMVLLAKESRISGKMKNLLYGWVSPGSFAPWEQRTCLEPNWDEQVVKDLHNTSIPVTSTGTGREFTSIVIGAKRNKVSQKLETQYRLDPEVLRYPVLKNNSNGKTYDATIFAKEGEPTNTATMSEVASGEAALSNAIESRSIVNLIMVIDGTRGMEKFFPYAKEAVKRAESYFKKDKIVRQVRVGGVIYRDYADGQKVTEILPMTSPDDNKVNWFFKGGDYGIKNSAKDRTDFEALYKGLEAALETKKMGYSRDNCNLMFVIGDAGNALNDTKCLSQEQIIGKCVENRIQLSSFLVRNIDSPASAQFGKQMRNIVMKNMERQYAKLGSNIKHSYKELADGYDFQFDVAQNEAYFIGGFRKAAQGQDMDESRLYSLVKSTSERFEETMSKVQNTVVDAKEIITDPTASTISKNLLMDILGPQAYNAVKDTKFIMAFEGRVPKTSGGGLDYWKPVIYISHPEFMKLMEQLKPVMEAVENNPEDRRPYVEAMKGLVKSMLPGVSDQMMMKMDNKEIMAQIVGLNIKTRALEKHSLIDIQNDQVVSPETFAGLVSDFIGNYRKLEEILERRYPFTTKRNGVPFYWIPAEDLP